MYSSRSLLGQGYLVILLGPPGPDERGRWRTSSFGRLAVECKSSDIGNDSETNERSRRRRLVHFERAARALTLGVLANVVILGMLSYTLKRMLDLKLGT